MNRSEASKAKRREYNRLWRKRNKDHCLAYVRRYESENYDPDYIKEKRRIYSKRHRERQKGK